MPSNKEESRPSCELLFVVLELVAKPGGIVVFVCVHAGCVRVGVGGSEACLLNSRW